MATAEEIDFLSGKARAGECLGSHDKGTGNFGAAVLGGHAGDRCIVDAWVFEENRFNFCGRHLPSVVGPVLVPETNLGSGVEGLSSPSNFDQLFSSSDDVVEPIIYVCDVSSAEPALRIFGLFSVLVACEQPRAAHV